MDRSIGLYAKAIVGAVLAGLAATVTALDDGTITGPEWLTITITVLVGLGAVWAIPNAPRWVAGYGKAAASGLVAALGSLATAWPDGITQAEAITAAIALLTNLGVTWAVPNAPTSRRDHLAGYSITYSPVVGDRQLKDFTFLPGPNKIGGTDDGGADGVDDTPRHSL
ncbi:hypothetical protein CGZ93_17975 [Enemella dayhoffiae]|uniref:Uncharacterized protein n=1 Tax=Enemella dayhoffiae TaxID=2016507 RepID=A0A255GLF8_9ACTN|nr:hypothetical protein [Enemella dayhoffiae]OYO16649.1 hypothetical protein CGZ93_17975 [Enemella dayhoffiae]